MTKNSEKIAVNVYDNSTDWGLVGYATTVRGGLIIGRKWAKAHSTQRKYAGYGPTIKLTWPDGVYDTWSAW